MPEPQLICTVKAVIASPMPSRKRGDAGRVHLIGDHIDAAENDLVERVRREWLAQQQRTAALDGEIDRSEWTDAARLEKRRTAAVDDVDGAIVHSAAAGRGRFWAGDGVSPCT